MRQRGFIGSKAVAPKRLRVPTHGSLGCSRSVSSTRVLMYACVHVPSGHSALAPALLHRGPRYHANCSLHRGPACLPWARADALLDLHLLRPFPSLHPIPLELPHLHPIEIHYRIARVIGQSGFTRLGPLADFLAPYLSCPRYFECGRSFKA